MAAYRGFGSYSGPQYSQEQPLARSRAGSVRRILLIPERAHDHVKF